MVSSCQSCGTVVDRNTVYCPRCGQLQAINIPTSSPTSQSTFYGQQTAPVIPPFQPLPISQVSSPTHPPTRNIWKLVCIFLIVLFCVLSGAVGLVGAKLNGQIDSLHADTTSIVTHENSKIAGITRTATAVAHATAVVQKDPYTGSGSLVLVDPLTSSKNWTTGRSSNGNGTCQFSDDGYHVSSTSVGTYYSCLGQGTMYLNYVLSVTMMIKAGGCGGFLLQENVARTAFYYVSFCHDGAFSFYLFKDNNFTTLQQKNMSNFNTGFGKENTIGIVNQTGTFDIYVNNQKFTSVSDSTLTLGSQALMADALDANTDIVFNKAYMWVL